MGMCIRVHGIFSLYLRAGFFAAAILLIAALPAMAQDPVDADPAVDSAVEPHWSPYTAPAGADPDQQVYIIVRGDCLWNLAARFYGDPLLWPQIWDANRYITDAHWIYPGDPLVIPAAPDVAAQRMVGGEDEFGDEPMPGDALDELSDDPVPPDQIVDPQGEGGGLVSLETSGILIHRVDVYCAPVIVPDLDRYEYSVTGVEEISKIAFGTGDVVYLDCGQADGVSAGDLFLAHHPMDKVRHPETRRHLGMGVKIIAELEVLCANEHDATALIIRSCTELYVGDLITPWEDLPVPVVEPTAPLTRCDDMTGGNEGYLVYALEHQMSMGTNDLMVIDRGSDDGVSPGDFFAVFRFQGQNRLMLGEAVVLRTERETATVKIISSFQEIHVGDRVDVK